MNLVVLGPPGVGKGTQAEYLCREFNLKHISTGDIFRENIKNRTSLGMQAKPFMERGVLVPDTMTELMVEERLSRTDALGGFVLDGFPRSLHQARALGDMLSRSGRKLAGVLYIHLSEEEIVLRLSGRMICRNCQTPYNTNLKPPARPGLCDLCGGTLYRRDDDNPETVRARLKSFHAQTEPLIEYYRAAGLLEEVDGEGSVSDVHRAIHRAAERILSKSLGPRIP